MASLFTTPKVPKLNSSQNDRIITPTRLRRKPVNPDKSSKSVLGAWKTEN